MTEADKKWLAEVEAREDATSLDFRCKEIRYDTSYLHARQDIPRLIALVKEQERRLGIAMGTLSAIASENRPKPSARMTPNEQWLLLLSAQINFDNLARALPLLLKHPYWIIAKAQLDEALGGRSVEDALRDFQN